MSQECLGKVDVRITTTKSIKDLEFPIRTARTGSVKVKAQVVDYFLEVRFTHHSDAVRFKLVVA